MARIVGMAGWCVRISQEETLLKAFMQSAKGLQKVGDVVLKQL